MRTKLNLVCGALTLAFMFGIDAMRGGPTLSMAAPGVANPAGTGGSSGLDCIACHRFDTGLSHPVGMVPSVRVPAHLPLEGGRMTCITCHDPAEGAGHEQRRASGREFLRGDGFASLCTQCHDESAGGRIGAHGSGLRVAHLTSLRSGLKAVRGGVDAESQSCLSCHDGAVAGDAGVHASVTEDFGDDGDHPIGVVYGGRGKFGDEIRLVSRGSLDRRIRLFDSKVGCGSCHSPYASQKNLLVMPAFRSQLCFGCHIQ